MIHFTFQFLRNSKPKKHFCFYLKEIHTNISYLHKNFENTTKLRKLFILANHSAHWSGKVKYFRKKLVFRCLSTDVFVFFIRLRSGDTHEWLQDSLLNEYFWSIRHVQLNQTLAQIQWWKCSNDKCTLVSLAIIFHSLVRRIRANRSKRTKVGRCEASSEWRKISTPEWNEKKVLWPKRSLQASLLYFDLNGWILRSNSTNAFVTTSARTLQMRKCYTNC